MNVRTILLLGKTGGGKSTLANVLINRNENFEEVFSESAGMTSETRQNQVEEFEVNLTENGNERIRFIIVDTVGLCDTRMTEIGVLQRISTMSEQIRDGLNQILFDVHVPNYTTIVHTHFPEFEDEEACERDRQNLRSENRELFQIIRNARIMYVDNPPTNLSGGGTRIARQNALNKEIREESQRRLLAHLVNCRTVYRPDNLDSLNERVNSYQTEEEKMQAQVAELQQRIANQAANHQAQINAIQTKHQQDLKDLEDKMKQEKQDLAKELDEKEKRIKEINDDAQKKMDKLQDKFDEANKKGSDSLASAIAQIASNNQSTGSALAKIDEEKKASEEKGKEILDKEKEILGLKIQLYGQSVAYHTEKEVRKEYEEKLKEERQKTTEQMEARVQEARESNQTNISLSLTLPNLPYLP